MKKHLIKLAILIPGLIFLVWWGWVGNFSFTSGSFYAFEPREDYYLLAAGQKSLGYARRQVIVDERSKSLSLIEDSLINLSLLVTEGEIRSQSKITFSAGGALESASMIIGLGPGEKPLAEMTGQVQDGQLRYLVSVGDHRREVVRPVPEVGPLLISAVIPWLARQRDLPLGRPIFFNLFDPSRLEFRPASLTIIDVTAQAEEKKVYKLALYLDPAQTEIWIDADGRVLSQKATGLDFGQEVINDPRILETAKTALSAPAQPGILQHIPRALLDAVINQGVGSLWPGETER
ncbi:MAG: hypothetical protein LBR11_02370 [Deltaproteobacteria bacterium]|nr:hypothetical protein [Deltaproteobacteria bacterium]